MQTNDRAIRRVRQHPPGDRVRVEFPVAANHGPHHSGQIQMVLHSAKPKPPHSERRTHQCGRPRRCLCDRVLRAREFIHYICFISQSQIRVGLRVVADLMRPLADCAAQFGRAPDILAALEKCGGNTVFREDGEYLRRRRAGAVVKGERDRPAPRPPAPH